MPRFESRCDMLQNKGWPRKHEFPCVLWPREILCNIRPVEIFRAEASRCFCKACIFEFLGTPVQER